LYKVLLLPFKRLTLFFCQWIYLDVGFQSIDCLQPVGRFLGGRGAGSSVGQGSLLMPQSYRFEQRVPHFRGRCGRKGSTQKIAHIAAFSRAAIAFAGGSFRNLG
jgi:hypothetical protein